MPKMVWDDADAFDDLPEEWDESDFEPYDGDEPPANTVLQGEIKKIWALTFGTGSQGFKVLFEAARNTGDREQYNGWSSFDNIVFTPGNAWRYGPLLETLGVTLRDVKMKTVTEKTEDNVGLKILRIGTVKLEDGFSCSVLTEREKGDGEYGPRTRVRKYMEAKQERKTSRTKAKATRRRQRDEDEDDDDDVPF